MSEPTDSRLHLALCVAIGQRYLSCANMDILGFNRAPEVDLTIDSDWSAVARQRLVEILFDAIRDPVSEIPVCSICGKVAVYSVQERSFCEEHAAQAKWGEPVIQGAPYTTSGTKIHDA